MKEAAPGYTCHEARRNYRRGICRTGIEWAKYDRLADEECLWCEMMGVRGEIRGLNAWSCPEGGEPWVEDLDDEEGGVSLRVLYDYESESESEDEDEDEGGAKVC